MGRNGTGKTTLLKSLVAHATGFIERFRPRVSHRQLRGSLGTRSASGYFAQDHGDSITKGMTAIDWLWQFDPSANQQEPAAD